jgi:hypothetical protein
MMRAKDASSQPLLEASLLLLTRFVKTIRASSLLSQLACDLQAPCPLSNVFDYFVSTMIPDMPYLAKIISYKRGGEMVYRH